jgi:hypothetical protein
MLNFIIWSNDQHIYFINQADKKQTNKKPNEHAWRKLDNE